MVNFINQRASKSPLVYHHSEAVVSLEALLQEMKHAARFGNGAYLAEEIEKSLLGLKSVAGQLGIEKIKYWSMYIVVVRDIFDVLCILDSAVVAGGCSHVNLCQIDPCLWEILQSVCVLEHRPQTRQGLPPQVCN